MAFRKSNTASNKTAQPPAAQQPERVGQKPERVGASAQQRPERASNPGEQQPERVGGAGQQNRTGPDPEQIARRAYERFLQRGGQHGRDQEDWIEAEKELQRKR